MNGRCFVDPSDLAGSIDRLSKIVGKCDHILQIKAPKPHQFQVYAAFNARCESKSCPKADDDSLYLIGTSDNYATVPVKVHWTVNCQDGDQIRFYLDGEDRASARREIADKGEYPFWIKPFDKDTGPAKPTMIRLHVVRDSWKGGAVPISVKLVVEGKETTSRFLYIASSNQKASRSALVDSPELRILRPLERIVTAENRVVGEYYRSGQEARKALRDLAGSIKKDLRATIYAPANYLIWAESGSGKTAFIRELGTDCGVVPIIADLAKSDEQQFSKLILQAHNSKRPTLCLIDEVDAKQEERWPYECCFSKLSDSSRKCPLVFVLIGSTVGGIEEMCRQIRSRFKGNDLMTRIFNAKAGHIIPRLELGDRAVIFCSRVLFHARLKNVSVDHIDKAAFYYVLRKDSFQNAGQIDLLAQLAIDNLRRADECTLRYPYLFDVKNTEQFEFCCANPIVIDLQKTSIAVR